MISVWAGSLEGLHHVCHVLPEGILASLHAETRIHTHTHTHSHTHALARKQATVFRHSLAGFYLHLFYWLMKHPQRGVRERQKCTSRRCAASLAVTHTHWHTHSFPVSVMLSWCLSQQTLYTQAAMTRKCTRVHTERHDTHSSADTHTRRHSS